MVMLSSVGGSYRLNSGSIESVTFRRSALILAKESHSWREMAQSEKTVRVYSVESLVGIVRANEASFMGFGGLVVVGIIVLTTVGSARPLIVGSDGVVDGFIASAFIR